MENNIDKLFKSKLEGQEPAFDPAAWERMEGILEASDMQPVPPKKSNKPKVIWIFFLVMGLLASYGTYHINTNSSTEDVGSTSTDNSIASSSLNVVSGEKPSAGTWDNSSPQKANNNQAIETKLQSSEIINVDQQSISKNITVQELEQTADQAAGNRNTELSREIENKTIDASLFSSNMLSKNEKNEKLTKSKTLSTQIDEKNTVLSSNEEEIISSLNKTDEATSTNSTSINTASRNLLSDLDFLQTKCTLQPEVKILTLPNIKKEKTTLFTLGIQASARFNEGVGYSVGPYLSVSVGKGIAVQVGTQYDVQRFDEGAQLSVLDKEYSFGSTLKERTFSMVQQRSVRLPINISKDFGRFSVSSGLILQRVLTNEGLLSDGGDVNATRNASVDHELIGPFNLSFHLGGSLSVNRFLALDFGVEYRTRSFTASEQVSKDRSIWYPSLGIQYKLFKF